MKDDSFFTNFGFKRVRASEKVRLVRDVFDNVASKYDLMNDLMSLGIHRLWKRELLKMLRPKETKTLLDVGSGTADVALDYIEKGGEKAYVLDINFKMLQEGLNKSFNTGKTSKLAFINADAEELPFKDNTFPAYSIAFCIRNVTNIDKVLQEAYRVLQPGGKFLCLEFSRVDNEILSLIYDQWSFKVIPKLGKYVVGDEDSYKYLVESIRKFPKQDVFAEMIKVAGFNNVGYKSLTSGIVAIHYGEK